VSEWLFWVGFFAGRFFWFLLGLLRNVGGWTWFFDGAIVVECVVKVVF
jgi:hypothetical protein